MCVSVCMHIPIQDVWSPSVGRQGRHCDRFYFRVRCFVLQLQPSLFRTVCTVNISIVVIRRIGFSIARRLAQDGAKVMVSSRKQNNVDRAVQSLRSEPGNLTVEGVVCHVGSHEHRSRLVEEVD